MCIKLNKVMGTIWINKNNNNKNNTKCNNITSKIYIHRHQNHRVGCIKYLKPFLIVLLAIICSVDDSNCFMQRPEHHKQEQSHSYEGGFVGEDEAKEIAIASNTRLAKIPCNISTKINCFYAEKLKFSLPTNNMHDHYQRNHQNHRSNEIVVSWVTASSNTGNINDTESLFTMTDNNYINSNNNNKNNNNNNPGAANKQSDLYDFNWIFELLACMMLASAFEVCLLILRNLRNISLAFYGFWSEFKVRIQKIFYARPTTASSNTSGSQRSNVTDGEKRTLSYIFAFLTWRATQTAKGSGPYSESNSREENADTTINYGHVTTMGDLLLLILFTHVYFLRQRAQQDSVDTNVEKEPQDRENITNSQQQFYDKKSYTTISSKDRACLNQSSNKHCSYYCGNLYHQPSSTFANTTTIRPLLQNRFGNNYTSQEKLATPTSSSYLTCCCDIFCTTCYLCQCSCRLCCYFCGCGNRYQRYYHNMPICNTYCCCCLYKLSKTSDDNNYKYSCWSDICGGNDFCCFCTLCSHCICHCCCHHHHLPSDQLYCKRLIRTYNSYCSFSTNAAYFLMPSSAFNDFLLSKIKTNSIRTFHSLNTAAYLTTDVHEYSFFLKLKHYNHYYCVVYMMDGNPTIIYKHSYYRVFSDLLKSMLPQFLLRIQNVPNILKWKKFQVAVVVIVLMVIYASSGTNCGYHHYYSSPFHKCKGLTARWCQLNKQRRKRCRRKHQQSKVVRSKQHHYLHASLIKSKRQKLKKFHKKYINNPQKIYTMTAQQQLSSSILSCEHPSLVLCTTISNSISIPTSPPVNDALVNSIKEVCGSKPNIVWLLIGLIWFEVPKIVNCNILHYHNHKQQQQQHEQQHQHHHQYQQTGNVHKETSANIVNSNFEYKTEYFSQIKTKNNSNNNSNNQNKKNTNTNNKNKNSNNNNDGNNSNDSNTNNNNNNDHNNKTNNNDNKSSTSSNINNAANIIPIINTIQLKHNCNNISKNYQQQKLKRLSQRVQRALQSSIMDISITSSASSNYNDIRDDIGLEKIQSSSGSLTYEESHAQSDRMRLESIKQQILFKLGLKHKPNVTHPLPKQFIWDTIYRADGIKSFNDFSNNYPAHHRYHYVPTFTKGSKLVITKYQQHRQYTEDAAESSFNMDGVESIKKSLLNIDIDRKKSGKKQQQQKTGPKYNNDDINYNNNGNLGIASTKSTKSFNKIVYLTTNQNTFNQTSKTAMKQHHKFHKNPQHITITQHQQQQHLRQNNKIKEMNTNNNIINKNNEDKINNNIINKNNEFNNNKNSYIHNNNKNIIITVQKHVRNNKNINNNNQNKYTETAGKFTYLTDIKSRDDSLNSVVYHNPEDTDENFSIIERQKQQLQKDTILVDNTKNINDVDNINAAEIVRDGHENYFPKLEVLDVNDDFFGITQEIITFAGKGKMYKNHRLVEFSHQANEMPKKNLHVRNAEIHIRIDRIPLQNKSRAGSGIKRKRLKIWIFQLIGNNYTYKGFNHVAQFCASFEVDTSRLGWQKFDMTATIREWYSRRETDKLRLLIDCSGCGKLYTLHLFNDSSVSGIVHSAKSRRVANERSKTKISTKSNNEDFYNITTNVENYKIFQYNTYNETIVMPSGEGDDVRIKDTKTDTDVEETFNSSRPFLVLHTEPRRQRRVRRRAINCNGALHGQCCRESFYVSFKALGWDDWIIAPRGYFANYCRGDCTGPYRTPDTFQTFHAHFIEEYRKMGLLNGMQPCCAPIKFSSMSLIYYGDEGIIKRDLPKMVVDECGCP